MNLRERILASNVAVKPVELPDGELGGKVWIRRMSLEGRMRYELWIDGLSEEKEKKLLGWESIKVKVLCLSLCDEAGKLCFDASNEADVKALSEVLSFPVVGLLWDEITELNTLTPKGVAEGKSSSGTMPS